MGHLRAVCILASMISVMIIALGRAQGLPVGAVAPMIVGLCALIAITPFRAHTRARRNRVTIACSIYTLGGVIFAALAIASHPTIMSLMTVVPPLMGLALSIWAYRIRGRRRVLGFSSYYQE